MTSDRLTPATIYDAVDNFAAPRLSQVAGVSQVIIAGADQPAVRVTIDPRRRERQAWRLMMCGRQSPGPT